MILWSLVLKKKEPAEFTFIERDKPIDSWFYNMAFDTAKNSLPENHSRIQQLVLAAREIYEKLRLFEEDLPEYCTEQSILIRRGYETLVCIATMEAFEVMKEKDVVKIRTNRYFFSEGEMKEIRKFIDVVINQGWF